MKLQPKWILACGAVLILGTVPGQADYKGGSKTKGGIVPQVAPTAKTYIGTDCDGSGGSPGLFVPTVCAIGAANEQSIKDGVGSCPNNYESGGYYSTSTIADLEDPLGTEVTTIQDWSGWDTCGELQQKLAYIESIADNKCNGDSCSMPSGLAADTVTWVNGDFTTSSSGSGLLVVTGTFDFSAAASWDGVILVVGEGVFNRSGTGSTGVISGSVVVANIAGPNGVFGDSDDCTGGTDGLAAPSYTEADNQLGDTIYCTDDITAAMQVKTYDVRHFRQR